MSYKFLLLNKNYSKINFRSIVTFKENFSEIQKNIDYVKNNILFHSLKYPNK